MKFKRWCLW